MESSYLDTIASINGLVRPSVVAIITLGLWFATGRIETDQSARVRVTLGVGLPLAIWLISSDMIGRLGGFSARPGILPIAILAPLIAGLFLTVRSRKLAAVVDTIPSSWLIGLQFYRIFGAVFLLQWARSLTPGAFALPAGIGDVMVGVMALVLVLRAGSDGEISRTSAYVWNAFGILDLVVALTMGFLSTPGPMQLFGFDIPNRLGYPLVMIPGFAVPLSLILHGVSLWQLHRRAKQRIGMATRLESASTP